MAITLTRQNSTTNLWYSENAGKWHWTILFEPALHQEFQFNGTAVDEITARKDIVNTLVFIERTYPSQEFFDAMSVPWRATDFWEE